jgi:hypothetical protein
MKRALERHAEGRARVVPILVRAANWQADAPFSHLQAPPTNGAAVNSWTDRDMAWADVSGQIEQIVRRMRGRGSGGASS